MALVGRLFPNAIFCPGIKHALDNSLHDLWDSMSHKDDFMAKLRSMEVVLRQPSYRDNEALVFLPWHGAG